MKRTAILLVFLLLVIGCNKSEPVAKPSIESVKTDPGTSQLAEAGTEEEFARTLELLSKQAKQFESRLEFEQANAVWKSIDSGLSQKFGQESWQPANARLAAIISEMQSNFTDQQKLQSKQVQELQRQLTQAVQTGDRQSALNLANESLQLTENLFGQNSPLVGKQLLQMGTLYKQVGNLDESAAAYHRAANILKTTFHSKHPDIELAHAELGQVYLDKGSLVPAISNLKVSAKLAAELWGEDSVLYARGANQLAVAYQLAGQPNIALGIHQAAELIRTRKLGPDHALVAHSRLNAGVTCIDLKDYESAERYLLQAVQGFKAQSKLETNLLNRAQGKLATVYMLTNRPNLAEPLLDDVVKSQVSEYGTDHAGIAELQYRLGIALARQGKYDHAEPTLLQALATQRRHLKPGHPKTVLTMKAMALLLKQTKRVPESSELLMEIERVARNSDSNDFMQR